MLKSIKIHEVGLRDGLQNEKMIVDTATKILWAENLIQSGIDILQLGSFVHKDKVPQMSDTDLLFEHFSKKQIDVTLSGLVLNEKGMERGFQCGVDMFCMGVSASNTHSQKNTGMTTDDALTRIIAIAKKVIDSGAKVQVSVQSAFGCGFEGHIAEEKVIGIVSRYLDEGLLNISLADTAGHAYPEQVKRLFSALKKINGKAVLTSHFHNTYGLGIANCYAAMDEGVEYFETAFGGLGGCPFTKVASGNVSTEDFVHALNRNNIRSDINLTKILDVTNKSEQYLSKHSQSYCAKAGLLQY